MTLLKRGPDFEHIRAQLDTIDSLNLEWRKGKLWHGDLVLDLIDNRLTDFYLQQNAVLKQLPHAHARYADKCRLALFGNAAQLQALGMPEGNRPILLEHLLHTESVDAGNARRQWIERDGLFFTPLYRPADVSVRTLVCCCEDTSANSAINSTVNNAVEEVHASYVFLLDENSGIHAIPHRLYVALARGLAAAPSLASQTLRLADWFVLMKDGEPDKVVNESYCQFRFDAIGYVDLTTIPGAHLLRPIGLTVPNDTSWPTVEEHKRMRALLFDDTGSSAMPSSFSPTNNDRRSR